MNYDAWFDKRQFFFLEFAEKVRKKQALKRHLLPHTLFSLAIGSFKPLQDKNNVRCRRHLIGILPILLSWRIGKSSIECLKPVLKISSIKQKQGSFDRFTTKDHCYDHWKLCEIMHINVERDNRQCINIWVACAWEINLNIHVLLINKAWTCNIWMAKMGRTHAWEIVKVGSIYGCKLMRCGRAVHKWSKRSWIVTLL